MMSSTAMLRRVLWRRRCCWQFCGSCLLLVALCTVGVILSAYAVSCSDVEGQYIIQRLCSEYKSHYAIGNYCQNLCVYKNLTLNRCINYVHGKFVFLMQHGKHQMVMKSHNNESHQVDRIFYVDKRTGKAQYPSLSTFQQMVSDSVHVNLQRRVTGSDETILTKVMPPDFKHYLESDQVKIQDAAMESLWSLVQQEEYLYITYLHSKHKQAILPKVLGTCGSFYAVEKLDTEALNSNPLKLLYFWQRDSPGWEKTAKLALSFLDLVKTANTDFPEPLHMCDIKQENFGVDVDGKVKLLDVDMVFLQSQLASTLKAGSLQQPCTEHSQCNFFHCHGWCHKASGNCSSHRVNNNLQMVCANIFQSSSKNAYSGLLNNLPEHVRTQIASILENCANPVPVTMMDTQAVCSEGHCDQPVARQPSKHVALKLGDVLARSIHLED